jgi:hypothetical protein
MEQPVTDLLVAAGYFRARIQSLSTFDKIIGGLVWAIDQVLAQQDDVDFQCSFTENASLGHKIKLADEIVKGLVAIKMPFQLQAHQIQGLDLVAIFPVVQWIVQLVIKARKDTAAANRDTASFTLALEHHTHNRYNALANKYTLHRMFKQVPGTQLPSIQASVESTLLEYGAERNISRHQTLANTRKGSKRTDNENKERIDDIRKKLVIDSSTANDVDVEKIIQTDAENIKLLDQDFTKLAFQNDLNLDHQSNITHKRRVENMKQQLEVLMKKFSSLEDSRSLLMKEYMSNRSDLENILQKNASIRAQLLEMERIIQADEKSKNSKLQKLKALIEANAFLKEREKKFKAECRVQHEELLKKIAALEAEDDDSLMAKEIESLFELESKKLQDVREALSLKNLSISHLSRSIDEVPSRAELLQYEKRFMELYDLVASKLQENKKVVEQYNVLEQTLSFLQKQTSLLNSIQEAFPIAVKTSQGKENFLNSVTSILDGVRKSKSKVSKDLATEVLAFELLNTKYSEIVEIERQYFKLLKDFQDECVKNERLLEMI